MPGLAGNVGLAPLEIADKHKIVVFELSSLPDRRHGLLARHRRRSPTSTPEHTDWHRDVERYYADKLNLIDRDTPVPGRAGRAARKDHPLVIEAVRDRTRLHRRRWRRSSPTASPAR